MKAAHACNSAATLLAASLLLSSCRSPTPTEPTTTPASTPTATTANTTPVTDACQVLTPAEISAVLNVPVDPGFHIPKASTIMCGWTKTGVVGDAILILNFTTPTYFENEREPHPRITMTPAPGIGDDAYYITTQLGTSLIIKRGQSVVSFTIRDHSIPSAELMEKERALGLKAAARL